MKTKKTTEIIFERREITRVHISRRAPETIFDARETTAADIQNVLPALKKIVPPKTRWTEKLRGFWKRIRR